MAQDNTNRKRILVVDDEPVISRVCARALTTQGFEVDIAVNGEVARDMLGKKDYDLCLIDIRTPVMSGKELYQFILSRCPKLASGVIFTTGDVADGYTQRFLELTRRPYLPKPFTPNELREVAGEVLGERLSLVS